MIMITLAQTVYGVDYVTITTFTSVLIIVLLTVIVNCVQQSLQYLGKSKGQPMHAR